MRFWTGFGPVGSTENVQREKKNQMQFQQNFQLKLNSSQNKINNRLNDV